MQHVALPVVVRRPPSLSGRDQRPALKGVFMSQYAGIVAVVFAVVALAALVCGRE
jgi:hypothetical protein